MLWALLSVQVVEVAGWVVSTVGVASGYSDEPVGSATDALGVLEYTGARERRGILASSVNAGATAELNNSDTGMNTDSRGAGRSLSGMNPEGMAPRAEVTIETMGAMGSRDSIGFGAGVG